MEIPSGFDEIIFPTDNTFSKKRWELGKMLFYDEIMSADTTISCASCHDQSLAFSDDRIISPGVGENLGDRNAPSLANVAYHPYFTREGGVPTLEFQVLVPIQEHAEFAFNIVLIVDRLKNDSSYVRLARKAYNREIDPFVITRSIASFERSLISGDSYFDRFQENNDRTNFDVSAERGMELFFSSKTNCSTCHAGFNFTNYAFENNGLYNQYSDPGRFRLTQIDTDRALFKVPSLRNIELTAPYMHDGSMPTLEDVIEHYASGGKQHINQSDAIQPLSLSETEKQDLLTFLRSLTDETFISNPLFNQ